jgi:hypothetical protein
VALSSADIEVGGPLGVATGEQALRDWFERAGLRLQLTAFLQRGELVIATEEAEWFDPAMGRYGAVQEVASVFRVRDGLVVSVRRYDNLESALAGAGFTRR